MDDHWSGVREQLLLGVHLSQEAEDPAGLLGDSVVGPAQVLVVPDADLLGLGERLMEGVVRRCIVDRRQRLLCSQFSGAVRWTWGGTS